ncbi:basic salivary proline-rich protein 1-like [Antechinus flavipes]|uniref:basic salivary proline-rich protein 1-like n=1 Tax=Antechinus flavipes TaxID=38775 RepID=UPI0022365314|nr:basic salivary proline-rich protein 1-like [Antechinus flavipes]
MTLGQPCTAGTAVSLPLSPSLPRTPPGRGIPPPWSRGERVRFPAAIGDRLWVSKAAKGLRPPAQSWSPAREEGAPQHGRRAPPSTGGGRPPAREEGAASTGGGRPPTREEGAPQHGRRAPPAREEGAPQHGRRAPPAREEGAPSTGGGRRQHGRRAPPAREEGAPSTGGGRPQHGRRAPPAREEGAPSTGGGRPQHGRRAPPAREEGAPQHGRRAPPARAQAPGPRLLKAWTGSFPAPSLRVRLNVGSDCVNFPGKRGLPLLSSPSPGLRPPLGPFSSIKRALPRAGRPALPSAAQGCVRAPLTDSPIHSSPR